MLIRLRAVRIALLAISAAVLVVLSPTAARADNGGIDTTYGTNGSTRVPSAGSTSQFRHTLRLASGGFVSVGSLGSGATVQLVAKFTAAGVLDTTFGTNGIVTIDVPAATGDDAYGVSLRPGGGYLVAGTSNVLTGDGTITKLSVNGVPDLTWGTGGTSLVAGGVRVVNRAIEDSTGDAVFAATDANPDFVVGRSDTNGDYVFNSPPNSFSFYSPVATGALQAGEIVSLEPTTPDNYVVVSYGRRTDGSAQLNVTTFSGSGPNSSSVTTRYDYAGPIVLTGGYRTATGQVLVTGSFATSPTAPSTGALWRVNAAGTLDASFGTAGRLLLPASTQAWVAQSITQASSGQMYVVGDVGTSLVRTMRLSSTFAPDTSFGDANGAADRSVDASGARTLTVVLDGEQRPLVVGRIGSTAALYRIELRDFASTMLGDITYTPSAVQRLKPVTWSFPVSNSGPDETDVTIDIDVPKAVVSATYSSTNGGTVTSVADGTGVTWTVPKLAAGATATLTLTGRASDVGTITVGSTLTSQSAVRVGAAPTPKSSSVTVSGAATPFDDVIIGTPQRDVIDALAGNDKVYALADNDKVLGNDGNDYLDLGPGNDTGSGDAGDDTVIAGPGNDVVSGGTGNDTITAGTGNDYATGGTGSDVLRGNDGNDRIYGNDGNDTLEGGRGNDLVHGGAGVDKLYGATGNDYLIGLTGNDLLVGGPGRDRVDGDGGNDLLYGGTGSDWLNGKTGNDVAYGGTGNDWLRGFTGNDFLVGQDGNDLLNGGLGDDRLYGGVGNDIFRADDGKGGDYVNCGSGWDLVYANPGDIVTDDCEFVKYDVFAVAMP